MEILEVDEALAYTPDRARSCTRYSARTQRDSNRAQRTVTLGTKYFEMALVTAVGLQHFLLYLLSFVPSAVCFNLGPVVVQSMQWCFRH